MPSASYSSRCHPVPTPRSSRPRESTSSVAACFASNTAGRSGAIRMPGREPNARRRRRDRGEHDERLEPRRLRRNRELPPQRSSPCAAPSPRGRRRRSGRSRRPRRPGRGRRTGTTRRAGTASVVGQADGEGGSSHRAMIPPRRPIALVHSARMRRIIRLMPLVVRRRSPRAAARPRPARPTHHEHDGARPPTASTDAESRRTRPAPTPHKESAYIDSVDLTAHTITIDPMEFLTGPAAITAFKHDNPNATGGPAERLLHREPDQGPRRVAARGRRGGRRVVQVGRRPAHRRRSRCRKPTLATYPALTRAPVLDHRLQSGTVTEVDEQFVP